LKSVTGIFYRIVWKGRTQKDEPRAPHKSPQVLRWNNRRAFLYSDNPRDRDRVLERGLHEPYVPDANQGVVIIIATSSASHATDQLLEHVLGRWCFDYNISTKSEQVYFRPDRTTPDRCCCSDMTDGVTVTQEGYSDDAPRDDPGGCLFDKIEQIGTLI
jgi:hypothetical protein